MLKFDNPALKPFAVLIFAFSFNDALSTPIFGNIPITPIQIAILYGIIYLSFLTKPQIPQKLKNIRLLIIIYYIIVLLSTSLIFLTSDLNLTFLTIGFNLLWFLIASPFLAQGLSEKDIEKFFKIFLSIILFITIPTGFYEFLTQEHIVKTGYGVSRETFYLRGLHIDKLEFGSMLACAIFISLINLLNKPSTKNLLLYATGLFFSIFLIAFSFSTTSMLGCAGGVAIILFYKSKKSLLFIPFIVVFSYLVYFSIEQSDLFKKQTDAYELKYTLGVEEYEERNFRYRAIVGAFEKVLENPFFGYGVGKSGFLIQEELQIDKAINTHNIFGNELLDYGIIGFLPLLLFLLALYKLIFIQSKEIRLKFPGYDLLNSVALALSIFMLFRFLLYYHRFDQTFYFIWASLIITAYGSLGNRIQSINKKNESINLCQET